MHRGNQEKLQQASGARKTAQEGAHEALQACASRHERLQQLAVSCACTLSDAFRAAAGSKSAGYEEKRLEIEDKNPFTADLLKGVEPSMPSNAAPNPFESEVEPEPEKVWQPLESESESSASEKPKQKT